MQKGWNAAGLLAALWGRVGGRDGLAERTGIQPATLSGINTGRLNLGRTNAERIAAALGVSLAELGAPAGEATDLGSLPVLDRLAALEAEVARLRQERDSVLREVVARLAALEVAQGIEAPRAARPSSPGPPA